jgi:hypothetical protein
MFKYIKFRKQALTFILLLVVGAMLFPNRVLAAPAANKGNLVGFIYLVDPTAPMAEAVVKIRSVKDAHEFQSAPTDKIGSYKLLGIDEGQYILGVSTKGGDYNLEVPIQIKGGETGKLSLVLKESVAIALLAKNAAGVPLFPAVVAAKAAFFSTPLGIATLAGASAAAVVGGVALINGPTPTPVSPSKI